MSRFRIASVLAVVVTLAACGSSASDPLGPQGPRMNGGLVVGANDTEPDTTAAPPTSYNNAPASGGDTGTVPGDTIPPDENGGLVVGGN